MQREKVYEAIDAERFYQDRKWGTIDKHPHEVGGYILLMQKHLNEAMNKWCESNGDYRALDELRKVLAIGVACAEQHTMPSRSLTQPVTERMRT